MCEGLLSGGGAFDGEAGIGGRGVGLRGEDEGGAGFVRGDGFGLEIDAGREVLDGESNGFVEAGFVDHEELDARGAALANEGGLAGEDVVFLM